MYSGSPSSTPFWRQKSLYLLTALFLSLYYLLLFSGPLNSVTLQVSVTAKNAGRMTFYLPTSGNRYRQSRSRAAEYPEGKSSHQFGISNFSSKLTVRFDPDVKQNTFQLHSLFLARSAKNVLLEGSQLVPYIAESSGVSWEQAAESLVMHLKTNDPQLILNRLPVPGVSPLLWLSPFPALLLLLGVVGMAGRLKVGGLGRIVSAAVIVLAAIYWRYGFPPHGSIFTTQLAAGMVALAVVTSLAILKRNWRPDKRLGFAGSLLIIAVLVTVLLGQMFVSLDAQALRSIKKNVVQAFVDNRQDGLNAALIHSRDALEKTFVRSFHFRKQLLALNAESKIFVLGFSPTTKVIIGRDDWFFEGYGGRRVEQDIIRPFDNITDYMGQDPFTEEQLEAWLIALEERYYWLQERGTDYVFALAPTKALVYPEKLPPRILRMKQRLGRPTRYDQLISYLKENSVVPVVDLRQALLSAKKQRPEVPLFYRTDFHWNYYGAFHAYQAIIATINASYPKYDLQAGELAEFAIRKKTNWVHARFMNMVGLDPFRHQNETYYTLFPKPGSKYAKIHTFGEKGISDYTIPKAQAKKFGKTKFGMREIDNPDGRLGMMFVIGDSFIEKTLGYFSLHNRRTMNFRVVTNFPTAPYNEMGLTPEIVVQEVLNMYLLQEPPGNPVQVRQARVRALAAEKLQIQLMPQAAEKPMWGTGLSDKVTLTEKQKNSPHSRLAGVEAQLSLDKN